MGRILKWEEFIKRLPENVFTEKDNRDYLTAVEKIEEKIIVLDDDPTGIQTVHSVPVYTSWNIETLNQIMQDEHKVVYILTNSRSLTSEETESLHRELARNIVKAAKKEGKKFLIISRSDSTLRGHYPLETEVLNQELEENLKIDGEIIVPFFLEGGRITFQDIHYCKEKDDLIPVARTEFARDINFGYHFSDLKRWVEEKTGQNYPASKVISISLDMIRDKDVKSITEKLMRVNNFNKVVVNAVEYDDLKVFIIALADALRQGKYFLFRTAASFIRVIGGIEERPLLSSDLLFGSERMGPGLVVIGSYVKKTTEQFKEMKKLANLICVEWDVGKAINKKEMEKESNRVIKEVESAFDQGKDACVYTSRKYHDFNLNRDNAEENLHFFKRISAGLIKVVRELKRRPGFLVAKGGITSSEIGVKALGVKKAMVLGQIKPGIPVWRLGSESLFPNLPYVIFPGNVGDKDTLKQVVEILRD